MIHSKRPHLLYLLFISSCRVIQRPPDLGGRLTEWKQLLQLMPALSQPVPSATCSATGCDYSKERETETKKKNRFVVESFVPASLKLPAPESCGLPEHCSPASTLTSSARGLEQVKGDFSSGEVPSTQCYLLVTNGINVHAQYIRGIYFKAFPLTLKINTNACLALYRNIHKYICV